MASLTIKTFSLCCKSSLYHHDHPQITSNLFRSHIKFGVRIGDCLYISHWELTLKVMWPELVWRGIARPLSSPTPSHSCTFLGLVGARGRTTLLNKGVLSFKGAKSRQSGRL